MTDISRIPTDLEWTAANGAHERLPIGRILRDQAAEIARLRAALKDAKKSLLGNDWQNDNARIAKAILVLDLALDDNQQTPQPTESK